MCCAVVAHFTSLLSAVKVLEERIVALHTVLAEMHSGEGSGQVVPTGAAAVCCVPEAHVQPLKLCSRTVPTLVGAPGQRPYVHSVAREASSLISRLPAMHSSELDHAYYTVRALAAAEPVLLRRLCSEDTSGLCRSTQMRC